MSGGVVSFSPRPVRFRGDGKLSCDSFLLYRSSHVHASSGFCFQEPIAPTDIDSYGEIGSCPDLTVHSFTTRSLYQ